MADKTLTKGYKVPETELGEAERVLEKSRQEREYLDDLIKRREEQFNKSLNPKGKISDLNEAFRKKIEGIRLEKDLLGNIKSKFDIPGTIDPALLVDEGVKDINIGALTDSNKLAKLKALSKILKGSAKVLPIVGAVADIAATEEAGRGSDVVPGRPTFEQMYPKINRTLAGKNEK